MTTAEERSAARAAARAAQRDGQRRLARPEEYVYDKHQEAFWDLADLTGPHSADAVDSSIPRELWRVVVEEGDPEPAAGERRRPGRPRRRREQLIKPSVDIMRVESDQYVEGTTWWPGKPRIIKDYLIGEDGIKILPGRRTLNLYMEPRNAGGDADAAGPWIDHVKRLWPNQIEHNYFFDYCAHMLQAPDVKCNTAIVLSGIQGIGKDAALLPVKAAVGATINEKGIDPDELLSPYKPWLQTLMLVVNEARPNKDDYQASTIYNVLKPLIAAPPDTLPLNQKYTKQRQVINLMRVFITTNDWLSMYIPPEDRRMFIMHSNLPGQWHELEGKPAYFDELHGWLESGGNTNVAAWLRARDISAFNPKAQSPRTLAWQSVADTWGESEDEVSQSLEMLGNPDIVFGTELLIPQFDGRAEIDRLLKSARKIVWRMQKSGYVQRKSDGADRFQFIDGNKRFRSKHVYVKQALLERPDLRELIDQRGKQLAATAAPQLAVVKGFQKP